MDIPKKEMILNRGNSKNLLQELAVVCTEMLKQGKYEFTHKGVSVKVSKAQDSGVDVSMVGRA